jgi:hypothetical protein
MDIQTLSRIKSKFVARQVAEELVIVPLSGNVAQMNELFTLNETGKFIWENVSEDKTSSQISALMTAEFDIDEQTAQRDVETFLSQMDMLEKYNN